MCLSYLLQTCLQTPSCTSVSDPLGGEYERAPSVYSRSWCSKSAEQRVKEKSSGCQTDWSGACSAGCEYSSGHRRFGNSEWRKHPAARCPCNSTTHELGKWDGLHWFSFNGMKGEKSRKKTQQLKREIKKNSADYLIRKVPAGAFLSFPWASSMVRDPQ